MVFLVRSLSSAGVDVCSLGVVIGHMAGRPWEVALTPVSWLLSMRSLRLNRPFPSSFGREYTDITGNVSSIGGSLSQLWVSGKCVGGLMLNSVKMKMRQNFILENLR